MPERDWQADMELCCKVQELMRKYEGYVPVDVLERKLDFPMQALKGWPAALEERARLEARVRELEEENTCLQQLVKQLKEDLKEQLPIWLYEKYQRKYGL